MKDCGKHIGWRHELDVFDAGFGRNVGINPRTLLYFVVLAGDVG